MKTCADAVDFFTGLTGIGAMCHGLFGTLLAARIQVGRRKSGMQFVVNWAIYEMILYQAINDEARSVGRSVGR